MAKADPKKYREVMEVIPWLAWEQRLAAYRQLCATAPTPDAVTYLVRAMVQVRDPRVADLLWELLADPKVTPDQAAAVEMGLLGVYGIENWYSAIQRAGDGEEEPAPRAIGQRGESAGRKRQ